MRKLLSINRIGLLAISAMFASCGTSEDSVKINDNTVVDTDTVKQKVIDVAIEDDSVKAITHGSPDQAKLDSIKKAKTEEKKK